MGRAQSDYGYQEHKSEQWALEGHKQDQFGRQKSGSQSETAKIISELCKDCRSIVEDRGLNRHSIEELCFSCSSIVKKMQGK
jgi:hypothetical protein